MCASLVSAERSVPVRKGSAGAAAGAEAMGAERPPSLPHLHLGPRPKILWAGVDVIVSPVERVLEHSTHSRYPRTHFQYFKEAAGQEYSPHSLCLAVTRQGRGKGALSRCQAGSGYVRSACRIRAGGRSALSGTQSNTGAAECHPRGQQPAQPSPVTVMGEGSEPGKLRGELKVTPAGR